MARTSKRRFALVGLGLCLLRSASVVAQEYPDRPITIVVPYAAGGPTDVTARRLAESMAQRLKTPVLVENKPGASTNLAAAYVAKAAPDGHTLLLAPGTMTSVNPYIYRSLGYRREDFAPITLVSRQAFVLTASKALPVTTLAEFIAYAQARPEGVTIGHVGTGSVTHVVGEWIARSLGIKLLNVPYKGSSQSTLDLIGRRLDTQIDGITNALTLHGSGKARILVSMGEERSALPPGVPTFAEVGYPELTAYAYFGLMAPAGTPKPAIAKLFQAAAASIESPAFAAHLKAAGELPAASASPEAYDAHLRREAERWGRILRPMNIQLD